MAVNVSSNLIPFYLQQGGALRMVDPKVPGPGPVDNISGLTPGPQGQPNTGIFSPPTGQQQTLDELALILGSADAATQKDRIGSLLRLLDSQSSGRGVSYSRPGWLTAGLDRLGITLPGNNPVPAGPALGTPIPGTVVSDPLGVMTPERRAAMEARQRELSERPRSGGFGASGGFAQRGSLVSGFTPSPRTAPSAPSPLTPQNQFLPFVFGAGRQQELPYWQR